MLDIKCYFSGEIQQFDLSVAGNQKWQPYTHYDSKMLHTRMVFSLCIGGVGKNMLCSTSMDRKVGGVINREVAVIYTYSDDLLIRTRLFPDRYFRINKFSGLLNRPSVQELKSVPALFVQISEISGLSEPGLTNHHCNYN